jgi:hypothetical protein
MIKKQTASDLLKSWQQIRQHLFSPESQIASIIELKRMSDENLYMDMRNTSNQKVLEFIDHLCTLPYREWAAATWEQPSTIQAFLHDRVIYVEKHLVHLGQAEVSHEDDIGSFVKVALTEWWDKRDIGFYA